MKLPLSDGRPQKSEVARINVFVSTVAQRKPHQRDFLAAFYRSLCDAGEDVGWIDGDGYQPCDIAVVYGYPKVTGRSAPIRRAILTEHTGPFVVVETAFLGRMPYIESSGLRAFFRRVRGKRNVVDEHPYVRIGIDGSFHDDADFGNAGSSEDRWQLLSRTLGLKLAPYRKTGSHVLIVGQKPDDASLRGCDIVEWMIDTVAEVRRHTERPIVVRAHPATLARDFPKMKKAFGANKDVRLDIPPTGTINDALRDCWVAVTYSSSAAINALLNGIPAISILPASMAWPVTDHDLSMVEHPTLHEREQWLYDLCYAQWSLDETARGLVWARLKDRLLQRLDRRS